MIKAKNNNSKSMAKITYEEKEFLNKNAEVADNRKVNDTDLNEIKNIVNQNDDNIGDLSNLETSSKTSLVNAINSLIRWKHHATFTGKTQYTLPKDFNELLIVGKNAGSDFFEIMVPKELLTENVKYFNVGGRYTSNDRGAGMVAQITLSFYKLDYFYEGGKEFPNYNDFTNYIYYR